MKDPTAGSSAKLIYSFKSILEVYSDETSISYLQATMTLQDLNTYNFADGLDSIRMSVGWRNPQEDAYDVHNFDIKFHLDPNQVEFTPIDGYCFGSIESQYY